MKNFILICLASLALVACQNTKVPEGGNAATTADAFQKLVTGVAWVSGCKTDEQGMEHKEVLMLDGKEFGASIYILYTQPGCKGQGQQQQQNNFAYEIISTGMNGSQVRIKGNGKEKTVTVLVNDNTMTVDGVVYEKVKNQQGGNDNQPVAGGTNPAAEQQFVQQLQGNWQSQCQVQDGTHYREILSINGNSLVSTIVVYQAANCQGQGQQNNQSQMTFTVQNANGNQATVNLQTAEGARQAQVSVNGNTMTVGPNTYTKLN